MKDSKLEKVVWSYGPLLYTHSMLIPDSIRTASQLIMKRRFKNTFDSWPTFSPSITGDGAVYNTENNEAVLYLTNTALNPVLKEDNLDYAVKQIAETGNYNVSNEDFANIQKQALKKNGSVIKIALSKLNLIRDKEYLESGYFIVKAKEYYFLNKERKQFVKRLFGEVKDSKHFGKKFTDSKTDRLMIRALYPNHVKTLTSNGPIARICTLNYIEDTHFNACQSGGCYESFRLLGITRGK